MKKYLIVLMALAVITVSCKKEEVAEPVPETYQYSFKDQPAKGKVYGSEFTFQDGIADISFFDASVRFWLFEATSEDICFFKNVYKGDQVIFGEETLKVGLTELGNSGSVTFYQSQNDGNNEVAFQGAYEILTIDTVQGLVTGRIDAKLDDDNFVNGNFTVTICDPR